MNAPSSSPTTQPPVVICSLCGGDYGSMPEGRHELCAARAHLSLPTPCLGMRCPKCQGRGWWRADGGPPPGASLPVYSSPYAMAKGVKAIFPDCPDCDGKGYTGGAR
jgi:hypothetical protein